MEGKKSTLFLCKHFGSLMGCTSSLPKTSKFISEDVLEEVVGSYRDAPPADFIYKIDSFSLLTDPFVEQLETTDFEVGGYKWKLSLYPNGDVNKNVKDHISVYLVICETSSLPFGWEVNVVFRFFLLDQIRDKYLMLGDIGGRAKRFHEMKTEMGFSKLIPISTFNKPSKGYLMDDKCVFGAEVLLVPRSTTGCGVHLSMVKQKTSRNLQGRRTFRNFTWTIENFSQIEEEFIYSGAFIVGNCTWNIKLYPKGLAEGRNKSISLYLSLADSTNFTHTSKAYTKFKLLVRSSKKFKLDFKNQSLCCGDAKEGEKWFCVSSKECGWNEFMELAELTNEDNGFLVNDTVVVEADITVLCFVQKLP